MCRASWGNRPESYRKMALSVMMESSLSVRPLAHSEQCRFSVDVVVFLSPCWEACWHHSFFAWSCCSPGGHSWRKGVLLGERRSGCSPCLYDSWGPSQSLSLGFLSGAHAVTQVWVCRQTSAPLSYFHLLSVFFPPPCSSFYSVFWQSYTRAIPSISI